MDLDKEKIKKRFADINDFIDFIKLVDEKFLKEIGEING